MSLTILGGTFRGRVLKSPKGKTRPTTSLLRKAVFDILQDRIQDAVFLDLFAGSGAMGLEALSRGARFAYFSESELSTFKTLKENISLLHLQDQTQAYLLKAHLCIKKLEALTQKIDILYIDPPYNIDDHNPSSYPKILETLEKSPLLNEGSCLFIESDNKEKIPSYLTHCPHLILEDSRSYSDSWLHILRKSHS